MKNLQDYTTEELIVELRSRGIAVDAWTAVDVVNYVHENLGRLITEDQAKAILRIIDDEQDANNGITWDTIDHFATKYLDEMDEKINLPENVLFLFHRRENDIFAAFPDNVESTGLIVCYSIVGQHSTCSQQYIDESEPATPEQIEPLKTELLRLGYHFETEASA